MEVGLGAGGYVQVGGTEDTGSEGFVAGFVLSCAATGIRAISTVS